MRFIKAMAMMFAVGVVGLLVGASLTAAAGHPACDEADDYQVTIPIAVRGPFVSDPEVIALLDCAKDCDRPLAFAQLIQARLAAPDAEDGNAFRLTVASDVLETVTADLERLRSEAMVGKEQLDPRFLVDKGSHVELVGMVNRMDRQFIKDPAQRHTKAQRDCGEISLIYRFGYSIRDGAQASRLPVTMNLVLPALPSRTEGGKITCQMIADRWRTEGSKDPGRTPQKIVEDLTNPDSGPLAFIDGRDIERLELNMQAYRIGAGSDSTDFGTKAAYLIRVFRWNADQKRFTVSYLGNQIDRSRLLCNGGANADCAENQRRRRALVAYLQRPEVVSSVDAGTLDLPLNLGDADKDLKNDVLARFATSISPGGSHRSGNQPYWKADKADEQIITDQEIQAALDRAKADGRQFSFIKSVGDFRTRLNEMSCTGCHQTRAIAGFHFPGADRKATPRVNAVLLPGSPHFYGDQVRRKEILEKLANGTKPRLTEYDLAVGYAARPLNRFQQQLKATELIGGWGGACLVANHLASSQRQWTCREGLICAQLFASANDPGIGTCVPEGRTEVGDALQRGRVITTAFGHDRYVRVSPKGRDTRIPRDVLPADQPPNSYYGAHQEYYRGNIKSVDPAVRRDAKTGGFPSGMLRLSECVGLPDEASCGLLASNGFTDCIGRVATDPKNYTLDLCFKHFTAYGGVRACDASNPCRDDYICVRSIGYTPKCAKDKFEARRSAIKSSPYFKQITKRDYDPKDYGELEPDAAWVARNDRRGICIPPYFVFQFRSDQHPRPPE